MKAGRTPSWFSPSFHTFFTVTEVGWEAFSRTS